MGIWHKIFGNPEVRILEVADARLEQLESSTCSPKQRERLRKLLLERKGKIARIAFTSTIPEHQALARRLKSEIGQLEETPLHLQ